MSTRRESRNASSLRRAIAPLSGWGGSGRDSVSIRSSAGESGAILRGTSHRWDWRGILLPMLEEDATPGPRWPWRGTDADQRLYVAKVLGIAVVYYGAAKVGLSLAFAAPSV